MSASVVTVDWSRPSGARTMGARAVGARTGGAQVEGVRPQVVCPPGKAVVPSSTWRLTRRGRLAVWIVGGICALLALAVLHVATAGETTGASQQTLALVSQEETPTVVVRPGDTLWGIAAREMGHRDPREAVVELRRLNATDGALVAGQRLVLPTKK